MAEGVQSSESGELLRLKECPACGYSLEALPAEGVCPECGRRYDRRYIVVSGQGRGRWDSAAGGTWRGVAWQVVSIVVLLWVFADGRGFASPQWLAVGVIGAVALAVQLYGWLFSAREPGVQLWVSAEGVGQVLSTPEARRAKFIGDGVTVLAWPVFYAAMVYEDVRHGGWVLMAVLAVVAVLQVVGWWRRRREWIGEEGAGYVPRLWPWGTVERIKVEALPGERARVRCMVTRKRWGIVVYDEWVVDIEIACSEGFAAALGRRMVGWCPGAGG